MLAQGRQGSRVCGPIASLIVSRGLPRKVETLLSQLSVPRVTGLSLSPVLESAVERTPGRDGVGGQACLAGGTRSGVILSPLSRARGEPQPTPGQNPLGSGGVRNVLNGFRTVWLLLRWSPFLRGRNVLIIFCEHVWLPLRSWWPAQRCGRGVAGRESGIRVAPTGGDWRSPLGKATGSTESELLPP